jgi:AsmA protein
VIIDGPWSQPRIYPEMAGILDNPDAAYGKLKEMGKGLFGPGGAGLGALGGLGGLGGLGAGNATDNSGGQSDQLGKIGETLGNMLQQGFSRSRDIPAVPSPQAPAPVAPPAAAQSDPPPASQDSQPMNDVLRRLFNR